LAELMREMFRLGGEEITLFLSVRNGALLLHLGEEVVALDALTSPAIVATQGDHVFVHLDGQAHEIDYLPAVAHHAQNTTLSVSDHLVAPMPGAVVVCAVKPGDAVAAGDLLLVIESMKLETPFKAWRAGRIASVHVGLGQAFERDKVLLSLEAV
jgi:biotin carboxyl carrier protein